MKKLRDLLDFRKRKANTAETACRKPSDTIQDKSDCIKFDEFGFWIESVSQVHKLLSYMTIALKLAEEHGYTAGSVQVFGGVHELDTGYETFPSKTYPSFETAKMQLPIDFAEEQDKLDGQWINTMNFEVFAVELKKSRTPYTLIFIRGELRAPEELQKVYLSTDWQKEA